MVCAPANRHLESSRQKIISFGDVASHHQGVMVRQHNDCSSNSAVHMLANLDGRKQRIGDLYELDQLVLGQPYGVVAKLICENALLHHFAIERGSVLVWVDF